MQPSFQMMEPESILEFDVDYPERMSRLGIFFILWLAVPHYLLTLVLTALAIAVMPFAALAILLLGRYPRPLWNFSFYNLLVSSHFWTYILMLRDEVPPFGVRDYPIVFDMPYPRRLNRLLIFVKWILLIPHAIILTFLQYVVYIVAVLSWFGILLTGRHPRALFDFQTGCVRWTLRVNTYFFLMTDEYPEFGFGKRAQPFPLAPPPQPAGPAF
jgi:hypothetical protein